MWQTGKEFDLVYLHLTVYYYVVFDINYLLKQSFDHQIDIHL